MNPTNRSRNGDRTGNKNTGKKKIILWSSIIGGSLLVFVLAISMFIISRNTSAAQKTAEEFIARLAAGDLTVVQMKYYPTDESSRVVLEDEDGNKTAQIITEQDLMTMYGEDLVMAGREEEEKSARERMFAIIMSTSQLSPKVKTVLGDRTTLRLKLSGPDFRQWMADLSDDEIRELIWGTDDIVDALENRLNAREIPMRMITLQVPMVKQSGSWKFDMAGVLENELFGGLLDGPEIQEE
ncbi:MAG: hypothetical protein LUD07_09110 [Clostridiales bacterium]|nr:hypothetical protein [Clostridiales bacterium]